MKVKITFDSLNVIDGVKDNFSLRVSLDEDVFNVHVVNSVPPKDILNQKADIIVSSAAGAIASFPDGAALPIVDLIAAIDPIQSLNGYANPWPAGGGVNKFDKDAVEASRYINSSGNLSGSNGWTVSDYIPVDGDTLYTLSGVTNSGSAAYHCFCDSSKGIISTVLSTTYAITTPSNAEYIRLSVIESNINTAQFEKGTVTSYSPYSNICPISGRTGVEVYRTGKNLLPNKKKQDGPTRVRLGEDTVGNGNYFEAGTYKVSYALVSTQAIEGVYWRTYKDGENGTVNYSNTITLTEGSFVKIWLYSSTNISADNVDWFQLELGSTATAYEAYNGNTYSLTWQTEAGTVYGATLQYIGGGVWKLTVTMYKATDLSSKTWTMETTANGNVFSCGSLTGDNAKALNYNFICNKYKAVQKVRSGVLNGEIGTYNATNGRNRFSICDNAYSDINAFKASISDLEVCYELSTPIEYTLTTQDIQEILTLFGTNNIWANSGDVSVSYRADTKLYIDNKIAQAIAAALNA